MDCAVNSLVFVIAVRGAVGTVESNAVPFNKRILEIYPLKSPLPSPSAPIVKAPVELTTFPALLTTSVPLI